MSQIPGPIEKRDILYGVKKISTSEIAKLVDSLQKEGWYSDACDFLGYAKDVDGLKKLRAHVIDEGDTFLFLKMGRLIGESESPGDELLRCAKRAEELGKIRYAMKAYEKLGDLDKVESLKASIAQDGDIMAEAEQSVFIPETEAEFLDAEEQES